MYTYSIFIHYAPSFFTFISIRYGWCSINFLYTYMILYLTPVLEWVSRIDWGHFSNYLKVLKKENWCTHIILLEDIQCIIVLIFYKRWPVIFTLMKIFYSKNLLRKRTSSFKFFSFSRTVKKLIDRMYVYMLNNVKKEKKGEYHLYGCKR